MTMPEIPDWHVVGEGIHEETDLPQHGGGLRVVHVVPYIVDSGPARGHHGTVRLEAHDFTPDGVKTAIDTAVTRVHGVSDLRRDSAGLA